MDLQQLQVDELEAMRAIFGEDWTDVRPEKTAWGTSGQDGWWKVRLKAQDALVAITLKGRLPKVCRRREASHIAA